MHDLVIHPRENDLVVDTFGCGFHIADIYPLQELAQEVVDSDVHFLRIETKVQLQGARRGQAARARDAQTVVEGPVDALTGLVSSISVRIDAWRAGRTL